MGIKFIQLHDYLFMRGHTRNTDSYRMLAALQDEGIKVVLNVAIIEDSILAAGMRTVGMTYEHAPLSDGYTISPRVPQLIDFTVKQIRDGVKTLVHCDSGRNRSALIVIPALSVVTGKSTKDLLDEVRKLRPIARGILDNKAFERYVLEWTHEANKS
jgi:protein-tyrosine phosphatase